MRRSRLTYIAIGCLMSLSACNQAEMPVVGHVGDSRAIAFRATLADAPESRSAVTTLATFNDFYVTSYFGGHDFAGDDSEDLVYFKDTHFSMNAAESRYKSDIRYVWPATALEFFAYSPALATMKATKDEDEPDNLFEFANNTAASGNVTAGYRMTGFRVHPDISRHFDFMTAKGSAGIPDAKAKADNTVKLAFEHRLSRINIQATAGSNKDYKFEIAGIRIGNPAVEGKYIFTDLSDETSVGSWDLSNMKKGCVEYIFKAGDKIIDLDENEKSIMGNCGNAMLIPANIEAWNRPAVVPENLDYSYTTDEMYFSVLLRAKITDDITEYPYWDEKKHPGMKVVYLAVDSASNKVLARVYKGTVKEDNGEETLAYFLDEGTPAAENSDQETTEGQKREQYFLPEGASIREFGWAAVPVGVDWEAGQSYRYTIDYSNGIGYHDPDDPKPGKFIIDEQPVNIKVTVQPWKDATAEFDPIVTVPYE